MISDGIRSSNQMATSKRISLPFSLISCLHRMTTPDCFFYAFCRRSYAEMPKEEKNKISHRSKALALVKSHFASASYIFQTDA